MEWCIAWKFQGENRSIPVFPITISLNQEWYNFLTPINFYALSDSGKYSGWGPMLCAVADVVLVDETDRRYISKLQ